MSSDLEQWYDAHAQAIHAFLLNLTRNEEDTRDLLQEVFRKLAADPNLIPRARHPRAFLIRLAHNLAIDLIRRRATRDKFVESEHSTQPDLFAKTSDPDTDAFSEKLNVALGELPPEQRVVVHLKLWEDLTFEQISETLEISANTAASRYRYGIDKLRDLLRPIYEEIK